MKLINGNPNWRAAEQIGTAFVMMGIVAKDYGGTVDMGNGKVPDSGAVNVCGTAACHAGWYYIIKRTTIKGNYNGRDGESFTQGADLMAKDLGFGGIFDLKEWARRNPSIWGNSYGSAMFAAGRAIAFTEDHAYDTTLAAIGSHWLKVAKRLSKIQEK